MGVVVYISLRSGSGEGLAQGMFGVAPYFDELFYAGFNIERYELGLIQLRLPRRPVQEEQSPAGALRISS